MDGHDVGIDYVHWFDRESRKWGEDPDAVEKEADNIFLRQPTEFMTVMSSSRSKWGWFLEELFSWIGPCIALYWDNQVLGAFKDVIYRLQ